MSLADAIKQVTGRSILLAAVVCTAGGFGSTGRAAPATLRLATKRDAYFVENDFVYRRFLQLARDGSYRQINRERTTASEVDRGTWSRDADGMVLLHFTRGGLRWHALLSGPLSIMLDDPRTFAALPAAAGTIRHWLTRSSDDVFASDSVHEMAVAPVALLIDPKAESFRRADLESLLRQIDEFTWSEQHQTFRLTLAKPANLPALLILRGTVFGLEDLPRVFLDYRVLRGKNPPFYFVQVDAGTFAREAGPWQKLPGP